MIIETNEEIQEKKRQEYLQNVKIAKSIILKEIAYLQKKLKSPKGKFPKTIIQNALRDKKFELSKIDRKLLSNKMDAKLMSKRLVDESIKDTLLSIIINHKSIKELAESRKKLKNDDEMQEFVKISLNKERKNNLDNVANWVFDDGETEITFNMCCETLGINSKVIKNTLKMVWQTAPISDRIAYYNNYCGWTDFEKEITLLRMLGKGEELS